jgi:hypothetical protein
LDRIAAEAAFAVKEKLRAEIQKESAGGAEVVIV